MAIATEALEVEAQKAIYTLLTGNSTLIAMIKRVCDLNNIPTNQPMPYIVVGETASTPFDVFGSAGRELLITFHTWSGYSGKQECDAIRYELYLTLNWQDLDMDHWQGTITYDSGYNLDDTTTQSIITHGVDRFRMKAQRKDT